VGHTALRRAAFDQPLAGQNSDISEALMGGANMIPGTKRTEENGGGM